MFPRNGVTMNIISPVPPPITPPSLIIPLVVVLLIIPLIHPCTGDITHQIKEPLMSHLAVLSSSLSGVVDDAPSCMVSSG